MSVYAVILCGGRGERFWPKSRSSFPKQFISLFGQRSLTQATSDRIRSLCPPARQLLLASPQFAQILQEQLPNVPVLFEPHGRNTAPAIGLAAAWLAARSPNATMVVLPADHLIEKRREFLAAVRLAVKLAQDGLLVTFGIRPTRPDTGYGYIKLGRRIAGTGKLTGHEVLGFTEKPDADRAKSYLAAGNYCWNSGMFVWQVATILAAFREHLPEFATELAKYQATVGTRRESAALDRLYRVAPQLSIDYAIMEKAENVAAVRGAFDWDDVGSWLALARHRPKDCLGNVHNGIAVLRDSRNCIVDADVGVVAVLGVEGLVIVRSGDAVLVASQDALGSIKDLLSDIRANPKARATL